MRRIVSVADGIAGRGGRAIALQAELGDIASIQRLFDAAQQAFGAPDIVVVNAGVVVIKPARPFNPLRHRDQGGH